MELKDVVKMMKSKKLRNENGFTLLELLVVVAILAAIAGTASLALKDTDARAAAAAHVAMMDELNKGIGAYRVLNKNVLPSGLDSLLEASGTNVTAATGLSILGFPVGAGQDGAFVSTIPDDVQQIMFNGGIESLRYVDTTASTAEYSCTNLERTVNSRANNVVAGNVFMSTAANGCGFGVNFNNVNSGVFQGVPNAKGMFWDGGSERLTGQVDPAGAGSDYNDENNVAYLLTGIGPSSSLFDGNRIGSMTTVPVYRHVAADEYNRFIAVWNVGTYDDAGVIEAAGSIELVAIIDGALDTKEEELGEWDGTRSTI